MGRRSHESLWASTTVCQSVEIPYLCFYYLTCTRDQEVSSNFLDGDRLQIVALDMSDRVIDVVLGNPKR